MLLKQLSSQRRVLGAVIMREIQTRWGRRNLGFAWLFGEPLVFAFPVLGMWSYLRNPFEHGLPLVMFLWSGYLPLLMFRHVTGHALYAVRTNAALLYHRSITPLDIILGRCGLEAFGGLIAIASSYLVLHILGALDLPDDYPLFLAGVFYMAWWSIAIALIVAAWSERSDLVEHIWMPLSYIYMPICGFFYLAEWLPTRVRPLALTFIPPLHSYEMIRAGLLGHKIQTFYSPSYLTAVLSGLTLFGLWLVRDVRRYIELE